MNEAHIITRTITVEAMLYDKDKWQEANRFIDSGKPPPGTFKVIKENYIVKINGKILQMSPKLFEEIFQ